MPRLLSIVLAFLVVGQAAAQGVRRWTPLDSLNALLPASVRAFEGRDDALRAWLVRITPGADVSVSAVASDDTDGKETTSEFGADPDVCVAVNGGYFDMAANPAVHVGLLLDSGGLLAPATGVVARERAAYGTARAALGFTADGRPDIAWVVTRGDSLRSWSSPPPNRPGIEPDTTWRPVEEPWPVTSALGAGPMLITNGRIRITDDEEVFFGTSIPNTHPRTAAGITTEGDLLLLVVDGRQPESRGVNLEELAAMLWNLGAVEALNLDGGGSSTMVVRGVRLNHPAGGTVERQVVSAIVARCGQGKSGQG